jgi:hypothetical protein
MTHSNRFPIRRYLTLGAAALALMSGTAAQAHCDTLDGPVVSEARKALDSGNVNLVLGWVQKQHEGEIRNAFYKAVAVRKANAGAKDLADMYFFETLVRVHRAGEGAPYTGLKPAGEIEPAIAAADKSIEAGKLDPVGKMVIEQVEHGLHKQFEAVATKKKYNPNDVVAARAYVGAYVTYVHYVEGLYNAAAAPGGEHAQRAQHVQDGPAAPQHSPATKAAGHAH